MLTPIADAPIVVCEYGVVCEAKLNGRGERLFPAVDELEIVVFGQTKERLRFTETGIDVFCDVALRIPPKRAYTRFEPKVDGWRERTKELLELASQLKGLYEFVHVFHSITLGGTDAHLIDSDSLLVETIEEFANA